MTIAVCLKWTAGRGAGPDDARFAGVSDSDRAALELGLRLGEQLGMEVVAVAVGPDGADAGLRDAVACGAARATRVDAPYGAASDAVAGAIAQLVADTALVMCGDASRDRGSGSVPAYLAHRLGRAQALGLVALDLAADGPATHLHATRRLDGGRRELVRVPLPCVVSVEGSVASLRRAGLRAALASRAAPIAVVSMGDDHRPNETIAVAPFRPRARALAAPGGDDVFARLRALTDASGGAAHGETVVLEPPAAAARIVAALREWGHLAP